MSAITVGGDLVHYEVLGRGRPVILVHGWLGSWRYWVPTMQQLHLKYRVYALDLFGFGDSGKNPEKYALHHQTNLIDEFMKQLGLTKAAFIGHGLGALILSDFALNNPDRVARLLISGAPLFDPGDLSERTPIGQRKLLTVPKTQSETTDTPATEPAPPESSSDSEQPSAPRASIQTTQTTKVTTPSSPDSEANAASAATRATAESSRRLDAPAPAATTTSEETGTDKETADSSDMQSTQEIEQGVQITWSNHNPLLESLSTLDLAGLLAKCFKPSEPSYEKLKVDVDKTDNEVLKNSVVEFDSGRMLDTLRQLPMPVVVVHGSDDPVIPQPSEEVWNYLTVDKEHLLLPIPLPGVRHFPMLEYEPFMRMVNQFLEIADISKLEIKERWVRRTR